MITLAFKVWAGDATDRTPMEVSVTKGGTKELVPDGNVFPHFQVMSNELNTPKILVCPEDRERLPSTNFLTGFSDRNISYFIGVDATDNVSPQMFLTGDRNLVVDGRPAGHGLAELTTNQVLSWTRDLHRDKGNVGLADASVQMFSGERLNEAFRNSGAATNRLAMP